MAQEDVGLLNHNHNIYSHVSIQVFFHGRCHIRTLDPCFRKGPFTFVF